MYNKNNFYQGKFFVFQVQYLKFKKKEKLKRINNLAISITQLNSL